MVYGNPGLFRPIRRHLHLVSLNGSCHMSDHNQSLSISSCSFVSRFDTSAKILASSAKSLRALVTTFGISFIYFTNNIGPKTDPCGTPLLTVTQSDTFPSTLTRCFLLVKNDFIQFNTLPLMPYDSIFF